MKIAVKISCLVAVFAVTACGGSKFDTKDMEAKIKSPLATQLGQQGGYPVTVDSLDCLATNDSTATCLAKVHDETSSALLSISVNVDTSSGEFIWTVDS